VQAAVAVYQAIPEYIEPPAPVKPSVPVRTGPSPEDLARAIADFPRFCALLQVSNIDGGPRIPMELTWMQRQFHRNRTKRDILLKARRVFATTFECARDIWWFLTVRGAQVVIVIQHEEAPHPVRTSIYDKIRIFFWSLRQWGIQLPFDVEEDGRWEMHDRDASMRVVVAGGNVTAAATRGRGATINRLHMSEVSSYAYAIETTTAMLNSMPRGADAVTEVVQESTAMGAAGYFYDQYKSARIGPPPPGETNEWNGYRAHFYPWHSHPKNTLPLRPGEVITPTGALEVQERALLAQGVKPEQIKWLRQTFSESGNRLDLLNQEHPSDEITCWLIDGRPFFDPRRIEESLGVARTPLKDLPAMGPSEEVKLLHARGTLRVWELPKPGAVYVVGADSAEGGGGDYSAGLVFEKGTGKHVATLHGQIIPYEFAAALARVAVFYNGAKIAIERNAPGPAVIQAFSIMPELLAFNAHQLLWWADDGKPGWHTNEATRSPMLDGMDAAHRSRIFETSDLKLLEEMRSFVIDKNGKPTATRGKHDDLVMAGAIGWAVCTRSGGAGITVGGWTPGISIDDLTVG
jgi:hypothetical protein